MRKKGKYAPNEPVECDHKMALGTDIFIFHVVSSGSWDNAFEAVR